MPKAGHVHPPVLNPETYAIEMSVLAPNTGGQHSKEKAFLPFPKVNARAHDKIHAIKMISLPVLVPN